MTRSGRRLRTAAALLLLTSAGTATAPAAAASPGGNVSMSLTPACANDFGTKIPVVLVHGFHEGTDVWKPLVKSIQQDIPDAAVVTPFDYPGTQWVTGPDVAPKLADVISCLAGDSAGNGGSGKVITVAHSMGGLAVRCAVSAACAGPAAAKPSQVGLEITLGTPNTGSLLATAGNGLSDIGQLSCETILAIQTGLTLPCPDLLGGLFGANTPAALALESGVNGTPSRAIASLPALPSTVPLDAIAGQVTVTTSLFQVGIFRIAGPQLGDLGDLVVSEASALDGAPPTSPPHPGTSAPHPGSGSGAETIPCGTISVATLIGVGSGLGAAVPDVTCWHETETTDAVWQHDVIAAIRSAVQALAPIDWNNRRYALTCDNIVQTPVNVAFSGGNATAAGPGIGPYDQWNISIDQVSHGVLPSLGNVTAVLFNCSPQPSNFAVQELRIYRTADGKEIGRIPEIPSNGGVLPGVFKTGSVTIANGHISADVMFYGPGDSHASGPSVPGHMSWTWDGQTFANTSIQGQTTPTAACPNSGQLLSVWNAAPAALRDSWAAAPITGFTSITCWNGWVVAVPVSPSLGNGEIVFSLVGNLHLITTTELHQKFSQEVCSSPNAPLGWKEPPLISCA